MTFAKRKKEPEKQGNAKIGAIPSLELAYVQDQLDKVSREIPNEIAEEVAKTGSVQKLNEVIAACREINACEPESAPGTLGKMLNWFAKAGLAREFVSNAGTYGMLAKETGEQGFSSIEEWWDLLPMHPDEFIGIAKLDKDWNKLDWDNNEFREGFKKNPGLYLEIAGNARDSQISPLPHLWWKVVGKLAENSPELLIHLSRELEEDTRGAFELLNSLSWEVVGKDPKMFVDAIIRIGELTEGSSERVFDIMQYNVLRGENGKKFGEAPEELVNIVAEIRTHKYWINEISAISKQRRLFMQNRELFMKMLNSIPESAGPAIALETLGPLAFEKDTRRRVDAFIRIANAGKGALRAFSDFCGWRGDQFFVRHPELFASIAEMSGHGAEKAFELVKRLEDGGKLHRENKEVILKLAGCLGRFGHRALMILENKRISEAFWRKPKEVMDMLGRMHKESGRKMFYLLKAIRKNDEFAKVFLEKPEIAIEAAKMSQVSGIAGTLLDDKLSGETRRILKLMHSSKPKFIAEEGTLALRPYRMREAYGRKIAIAAGFMQNEPEVHINFAYAAYQIGEEKTIALHKEFGIEYFARYTPNELEIAYGRLQGGWDGRPVLLILNNKSDHNQAFYQGRRKRAEFLKYYNVVIVEAETESEAEERIYAVGQMYGKIKLTMPGGHGDEGAIRLGSGTGEEYELDLTDTEELMRLKAFLAKEPVVVLNSCSTGKVGGIGEKISKIWGAELFAPKVPTWIKKFVTTKKGKLVDVVYMKEGTKFNKGVETKK